MLPTVEESRGYDFQDPANAEKWRGLFVNPLRKILQNVHPTLSAEQTALEFVESLCLRLLAMLCAVPSPLTVQDVEERVARTFPTPLDRWALTDARDASTVKRKKLLNLPLDKLHQLLQKEVLQYKIDTSVSLCMTAILEYVSTDVLRLAGNFVKQIPQKSGYHVITCTDIKTAMCADKVLMDMFYQESELAELGMGMSAGVGVGVGGRRASLSYGELVRELVADVRTFLRDLNLVIRVFKDEIEKLLNGDTRTVTLIFGNIVDIYELTVTLLGNFEDALEVSQDSPKPYIGSCFEELAEVEEFRAFVRYANIVTRKESRDALQNIVDDPLTAERLETAGHGFRLAVKYCLPRLLLAPLGHVLLYHAYVRDLLRKACASDDRESFKQVECNLLLIKNLIMKTLGNGPKLEGAMRCAARARRQLAIEKCGELARLVDNWDPRDVPHCCNEFIREDTLSKIGPGKRIAERRAFLFDGLLLLCKPITGLVTVNSGAASGPQQLKLKEKLHIRKLEIVDRDDGEEGRHLMELCPRVGAAVVLGASSAAEKRHWMCDLVLLNTRPMLERSLDAALLELERRHPLRLPPPHLYRFAEPDSPDNLVLEDRPGAAPLVRGATLLKLVERLTYHVHADLNLVRTFLTTYRSFCAPAELLDLLIERFHIPEPHLVYVAPAPRKVRKEGGGPCASLLHLHTDIAECVEITVSSDAEKLSKNTTREDWKRYRKEFQQPVKFRVINVLRHWVDQHFYDFERDPALLEKLRDFLHTVHGKHMKKWVQSVLKTLHRKCAQSQADRELDSVSGSLASIPASISSASSAGVAHVFDRSPPPPLRHLAPPQRYDWHPLALHPLELARQLTLLEFQLYRQVKPSELVGAVWTKKDKEKTSPNLLKIIKHTTNFTLWMEKWIVETSNLEERAAVVARLLQLALALRDLNNFNGVLAVLAACGSASVHRLRATTAAVPPRLLRHLAALRDLCADHFRRYQERLRSINPPCVPFLGMYLTNILHIEEGNLDYLQNTNLINFSKRRKVAEITGEIQQYQNQPYCLTVEPKTRAFLESLDPFPGMDDIEVTNYLYAKSLEIEPRAVRQLPKFPRSTDLSLNLVKVPRRALDGAATNNHASASTTASTTSLASTASFASCNDDTLSVAQLSPTSGWDGASVASLPVHDHGREERGSLTSPRLERSCSSSLATLGHFGHLGHLGQLSLFDKGIAFFDKSKSVATLNRSSAREEPPSPRDHHSPSKWSTSGSMTSVSSAGGAGGSGAGGGRRSALSPRGAIVDAELFYSSSADHLPPRRHTHTLPHAHTHTQERVPPLLPRAACSGGAAAAGGGAAAAGGSAAVAGGGAAAAGGGAGSPPPSPPDRPPPSPKHHDLIRSPAMSPKRSPAPAPPISPLDRAAFSFPSATSPSAHQNSDGAPPPLPPRRRRDSTAPHTPHLSSWSECSASGSPLGAPPVPPAPAAPPVPAAPPAGAAPTAPPAGSTPPPLPPRPPPPPELMGPAHSALLQRRHTASGLAPKLPPKPAAVAPRT